MKGKFNSSDRILSILLSCHSAKRSSILQPIQVTVYTCIWNLNVQLWLRLSFIKVSLFQTYNKENRVQFPAGTRYISFLQNIEAGSDPFHAQIEWVTWALAIGVKRPEPEADNLHSSSVEVKNNWNYTPTPLYVFTTCTGKTLRSLHQLRIPPGLLRFHSFKTKFYTDSTY